MHTKAIWVGGGGVGEEIGVGVAVELLSQCSRTAGVGDLGISLQ